VQTISKISQNALSSSFSVFHNNVVSLKENLENLQTHLLEELECHFDVLGISETKITKSNVDIFNNNNIFISFIKYTSITPPANSKANRGRWCINSRI